MFTHILLASDGSDYSLKAAEAACEIAVKFGANLTLLSVFNPPTAQMTLIRNEQTDPELDEATITRLAEDVQVAVERRTGEILDKSGLRYECRRETGHPVDMIVSVAARIHCDLIVLGSRGLGGMESFLLGSVSERVTHHARCPVLIVK
jgi:nucleotide-binding universal stress UspA family protein